MFRYDTSQKANNNWADQTAWMQRLVYAYVVRQPQRQVFSHRGAYYERLYAKHFCEINLNFDQWFRRCPLKIFLFLAGSLFVHQWEIICEIFAEGIMKIFFVKSH